MSIQSEIDRLNATKRAIKAAIIEKGQSVADTDPFSSYADKISAIDIIATDDGAGNVTITVPDGSSISVG